MEMGFDIRLFIFCLSSCSDVHFTTLKRDGVAREKRYETSEESGYFFFRAYRQSRPIVESNLFPSTTLSYVPPTVLLGSTMNVTDRLFLFS